MNQASTIDHIPLPYWRAALAEVSLLHPEIPAASKPLAIGFEDGEWRVRQAAPSVAAWAAAQFAASKARADGKEARAIPFLLIPARLSEQARHGVKWGAGDIHLGRTLLCIPCLLERSGVLRPDPERQPWIPRDLLAPTMKPVVIGELSSQDRFIGSLPLKAASLGDALQIASELFAQVTGAALPLLPTTEDGGPLPEFALDGHELVSEWHGLPYEPPVVARHLIRLYDQIIGDQPALPLLDCLRAVGERPAAPPPAIAEAEAWHANTVGHINHEHPLSPSQREAMVELARLKDGAILAVNGPPGTGKTTLLQSVVAQLWVDAALNGADCPLILVASTNVKAVENVLDSFAKICAETGHERWLPYQGGFGLFLASESRESHHPTCTAWNHSFTEHETPEAVARAEAYYLAKAAALFPQEDTVGGVSVALRQTLQYLQRKMQAIVAARYALFRAAGDDPSEGAQVSCARLLAEQQALIDAAQAAIEAAQHELDAQEQQARVLEGSHQRMREEIDRAEKAWLAYLEGTPWWMDLLSFLPPVLRRRQARDRNFLLSNALTADLRHRDDGLEQHFKALRERAAHHRSQALLALKERRAEVEQGRAAQTRRREAAHQARARIDGIFHHWLAALQDGYEAMRDIALNDLNDAIDIMIRAVMFGLADRYWSGQWLLEMRQRLINGERDSKGRVKLEAKYRRFAKLAPCLVSNFHMAPAFFTAWRGRDMPFWNTIDLLIVDEAGQVSPDVGAAMFALARKAMVVGDTYQIEPIWNNGEECDRANAVKFGLLSDVADARYDAMEQGGYTPASGSLMRVANQACRVQKYRDVRGLMLTEHRRCVPELIGYCNELIYAERLQPLRQPIPQEQRLLPPFGWLNVAGQDRRAGASRQNPEEAQAIVDWLKANRADIERHYADDSGKPTPLWKLLGIVTPFAAQAGAIQRLLRKEMPDLLHKSSRLTVGTVHALQGAERSIVIFSPTYGPSFTGSAFYDQKPNMLNVAVSRAKDSFLVIGNAGLFDKSKSSRPSGLLARYLFHPQWGAQLAGARKARLVV
ncbi:DEAD/DEAH box helicase [Massilia sp. erpn]|uniref:DEAD/DEAH box helicase n=1 Tax=Massilia sp. erpn TaxID=2738142 RepID=UPI002106EDDB|nr:AAA domain-containing protein [Massilia sp. erpn]UTY58061.1 AAA family ATPase [Massilia sp. erpn]